MGARPSDTLPVKSADRTLDILELLAGEQRGLTISEISSRLSFARSSTHGLVHTLESRGYLSQDGGRFWHALLLELPEITAVAFA